MRKNCSINGVLFALLLIATGPVSAEETANVNCAKPSAKDAPSADADCTSEYAFAFGKKIQAMVEAKNLNGLFGLVNGELRQGPRKKLIVSKTFSDVFSEQWRADILKDVPPRRPIGWRGYTLANGAIWFDQIGGKWSIFAINGAKALETLPTGLPLGWTTDKGLIPPQCFVKEWLSSDNFEAFENAFEIPKKQCSSGALSSGQTTVCPAGKFRQNPGLYLGAIIPTLDPITPKWSGNEKITLAAPLAGCLNGSVVDGRVGTPQKLALVEDQKARRIKSKLCEEDVYCTEYAYGILGQIPAQSCTQLAPYLKATCAGAYLIEVGDYSGGSMGWQFSYTVYGLFSFGNQQSFVVPLKNFPTKNDALNYVDTVSNTPAPH